MVQKMFNFKSNDVHISDMAQFEQFVIIRFS